MNKTLRSLTLSAVLGLVAISANAMNTSFDYKTCPKTWFNACPANDTRYMSKIETGVNALHQEVAAELAKPGVNHAQVKADVIAKVKCIVPIDDNGTISGNGFDQISPKAKAICATITAMLQEIETAKKAAADKLAADQAAANAGVLNGVKGIVAGIVGKINPGKLNVPGQKPAPKPQAPNVPNAPKPEPEVKLSRIQLVKDAFAKLNVEPAEGLYPEDPFDLGPRTAVEEARFALAKRVLKGLSIPVTGITLAWALNYFNIANMPWNTLVSLGNGVFNCAASLKDMTVNGLSSCYNGVSNWYYAADIAAAEAARAKAAHLAKLAASGNAQLVVRTANDVLFQCEATKAAELAAKPVLSQLLELGLSGISKVKVL